ncbi:MAG: dienelactone hydrolase [Herbaspirillum sp.]|jgi:dienelactone hydrolase|nr:dienelactone hydrolase [Herbaspirillum sp.]
MHANIIAALLLTGAAGLSLGNARAQAQTLPKSAANTATPAAVKPSAPAQAAPSGGRPMAEKISFNSADMQDGKPLRLSAIWVRGAGVNDRVRRPTVIAMHGCGGLYSIIRTDNSLLTPRTSAMVRELRQVGYNTLLPDSLTPRGKHSICTESPQQSEASAAMRTSDIQASLRWLAKQDDVDPTRIVLLGWGQGGSTVMQSLTLTPERNLPLPKAAIAFYPNCGQFTRSRIAYKPALPLLILTGAEDDWTPADQCRTLADKTGPSRLTLNVYQDSYHEFDAPGMMMLVRLDVPNPQHPGQGVTSGVNTEAKTLAYRDMLRFLDKELN